MILLPGHMIGPAIAFVMFTAPLLADPSASAQGNQPRIWIALSGDTIELDGQRARLSGVSCAPPDSPDGRTAKALLNTFLRAGHVRCTLTETTSHTDASCAVNGSDINAQMRGLPGCQETEAKGPEAVRANRVVERRICPADPDVLWRDPTGLGPMTEQIRLLLYSLQLSWRTNTPDACRPR